jgi:aryl-alcohol dehydrogenase-like predicted oxidoreductase
MYWGTSEWSAAEIVEAIAIAEKHHLHKPVTEQPQYNLFERGRMSGDYVRFYKDYGYGSTIWSPLASGLLTGKYNKGIPKNSRGALKGYEWLQNSLTNKEKLAKVAALGKIAEELNCTTAQLALAWCLKNPNVSTVITGATSVKQLHENMKAAEVAPKLTPDVLERIDKAFGVKQEVEED